MSVGQNADRNVKKEKEKKKEKKGKKKKKHKKKNRKKFAYLDVMCLSQCVCALSQKVSQ